MHAMCKESKLCVVSHKRIEPNFFSVIINTSETFKGVFGIVLPVSISEIFFLAQSFYVKRHSLLSLHLARTLVPRLKFSCLNNMAVNESQLQYNYSNLDYQNFVFFDCPYGKGPPKYQKK